MPEVVGRYYEGTKIIRHAIPKPMHRAPESESLGFWHSFRIVGGACAMTSIIWVVAFALYTPLLARIPNRPDIPVSIPYSENILPTEPTTPERAVHEKQESIIKTEKAAAMAIDHVSATKVKQSLTKEVSDNTPKTSVDSQPTKTSFSYSTPKPTPAPIAAPKTSKPKDPAPTKTAVITLVETTKPIVVETTKPVPPGCLKNGKTTPPCNPDKPKKSKKPNIVDTPEVSKVTSG